MYITLEEYQTISGNVIDMAAFVMFEYKARMRVDHATFNRFAQVTAYPEQLTMLMVELINHAIATQNDTDIVVSRSSSSGGVSQSESYNPDTSLADKLITEYLSGVEVDDVPVLYRG